VTAPAAVAPAPPGAALTEDEARAWRTYFVTSARLQTRLNRELRAAAGLTLVDYDVLLALTEAPAGCLRMGELADALVFSPSRLTYQVASMAERGLVRRERVDADGRGLTAAVTDEGRRVFAAARREHRRSIRRLFLDHLDHDDLRSLERVFGALRDRLADPAA
jgi:DNA-binding MarR family transcriptional regulator